MILKKIIYNSVTAAKWSGWTGQLVFGQHKQKGQNCAILIKKTKKTEKKKQKMIGLDTFFCFYGCIVFLDALFGDPIDYWPPVFLKAAINTDVF